MTGSSKDVLRFVNSIDDDLAQLSHTLPRCWSADMAKWEQLLEHFKDSKVFLVDITPLFRGRMFN